MEKLFLHKQFRKTVKILIAIILISSLVAPPSFAQMIPSVGVTAAVSFEPPVLKGLTIYPQNPLYFTFIFDRGQDQITSDELKAQGEMLVKHFFAAMTIPEKEAWVNLSPYEKDRIIPDALSQTDMGRIMLEQDYQLKQLAASLTNPNTPLGKKYWEQIQAQGNPQEQLSETNKNLLSKVWIIPDGAKVVEKEGTVYILESKLKVQMDNELTVQDRAFRDMILPQLEKEVNLSKAFAPTRQVFQSVILAAWYKQALKQSLLGQVYADRSKIAGIESSEKGVKDKIYEQYLTAFKKGAYTAIKEEVSPDGDIIPRKYFSGGMRIEAVTVISSSAAGDIASARGDFAKRGTRLSEMGVQAAEGSSEKAVVASVPVGPTPQWHRLPMGLKDAIISVIAGRTPDMQSRSYAFLTNDGQAAWAFDGSGYAVENTKTFWEEASIEVNNRISASDTAATTAALHQVAAYMLDRFQSPKVDGGQRLFPKFEMVANEVLGDLGLKKASASVVVNDKNSYEVAGVRVLDQIFREVNSTYITQLIVAVRAKIMKENLKSLEGNPLNPLTMTIDESLPEKTVVFDAQTQEIRIPKSAIFHEAFANSRILPEQIDEDFWYASKYQVDLVLPGKVKTASSQLDAEGQKEKTDPLVGFNLYGGEQVLRDLIFAYASPTDNPKLAALVAQTPHYPSTPRESLLAQVVFDLYSKDPNRWLSVAQKANRNIVPLNNPNEVDVELILAMLSYDNPLYEEVVKELKSLPRAKMNARASSAAQEEWPVEAKITKQQVDELWARVKADGLDGNPFFKQILRNFILGLIQGKFNYPNHGIVLKRLMFSEQAARDLKVNLGSAEQLEKQVGKESATIAALQEAMRKVVPVILLYGAEGIIERLNLGADANDANIRFVKQLSRRVIEAEFTQNPQGGVTIDLQDQNPVSLYDYLPTLQLIAELTQKGIQEASPKVAASATEQTYGGINFDPTLLNLQIKRDGKGVPLPLPQQDLQHINIPGIFPVIINIQPLRSGALPLFSEAAASSQVALNSQSAN